MRLTRNKEERTEGREREREMSVMGLNVIAKMCLRAIFIHGCDAHGSCTWIGRGRGWEDDG